MFTGIIREVREIRNSKKEDDSLILEIGKPTNFPITSGSSISTNGVCLTVREVLDKFYLTELMKETLDKTSFGKKIPKPVNLEPALKVGDSIGGHFVMGHIDNVGIIKKIEKGKRSWKIVVKHQKNYSTLIISRGSVAVNGVSLTVADCRPGEFSFNLVDYTIKHTTFLDAKEGDMVNIEYDMLGKYLLNKNSK